MSDWRQIQARIRKARTSADPPGQLSALYDRTHDAMVAFELAQLFEKAGATSDAVRWFTTAAERFRRPQWKQKAEEGLVRLGVPIPVAPPATAGVTLSETTAEPVSRLEPIIAEFSEEQPNEPGEEMNEGQQESVFEQPPAAAAGSAAAQTSETGPDRRRRRRGRRGGRGRHKGARTAAPASAATVAPPVPPSMFDRVVEPRTFPSARPAASAEVAESRVREPEPVRSYEPAASSPSARVRSGDPALSSRMAQLESQLRRLLACSIHSLEQADEAPAGPGVFLITDTDQTTYYYAEACQTLRVGIGNMLRSGRGSREGSNLKEKLAEHLGINEARVGKYLKDHCGVRWLQLDEGAPLLAHFAVAVLRPISNE
ncbi:MAG TPA: hypothetical protein VE077_00705 [Candidatus Methylomirabilis sp.]|nr:hypothetical protein [Candidatus Methylomirabilis sp.]